MLIHNPLNQFIVYPIVKLSLYGYDISFTNASLFMLLATLACITIMLLATKNPQVIPSKMQVAIELLYQTIDNMLASNVTNKARKHFVPLIFSLFTFILFCNLLGMLPYGFTVTSQVITTFALASILFIVITIAGFYLNGVKFLSLFLPEGTPLWLSPIMIIIEFCTYLARPVSLSLRLAANMIAGHVLLKVMAGFISLLFIFIKPLPMAFVVALIGLEFFIAILQAYIFAVLSCVYLGNALDLH